MTTVVTKTDIENNLQLFERYLCEGAIEEQKFCTELIRKGSCFIAYKVKEEIRFSPSRYVGYLNNTMQGHHERAKDGKETNPAIEKILGRLAVNDDLEREYLAYCANLGVTPYKKKRKYWTILIEGALSYGIETNEGFPEGNIVERRHLSRERNSALIAEAKSQFFKNHNRLFCEVCGFDFKEIYGQRGENYIEAHHTLPVSEMQEYQKTKISDLAMVCSNCHRVLHRTRPWLTVGELKNITKKHK
jgi:hypothetical protein